MPNLTVSPDATGLPAFLTTSLFDHPRPAPAPAEDNPKPTLRFLDTFTCPELQHERSGAASVPMIPVVYRADPSDPTMAVAVLVYILPDNAPGTMAYTTRGLAIVSDEWLAASVPARPKLADEVAAVMRDRARCRLTTKVDLSPETRQVAEVRRQARTGSRMSPEVLRPFIDIGRASALTADKPDPKAAAMLLAHTAFGVTIGHIASAFQIGWQEVHDTVEAAKLLAE